MERCSGWTGTLIRWRSATATTARLTWRRHEPAFRGGRCSLATCDGSRSRAPARKRSGTLGAGWPPSDRRDAQWLGVRPPARPHTDHPFSADAGFHHLVVGDGHVAPTVDLDLARLAGRFILHVDIAH